MRDVPLCDETPGLPADWHSADVSLGAIKIVIASLAGDKALLLWAHILGMQVKRRLEKKL